MHVFSAIFFFLTLLHPFLFCEESPAETGTLIVSYQTGPKGERLNRVRFVLTKEGGAPQIYPKEGGCVEDAQCLSRLVVLENLPVGKYGLKFLVPNIDGLFEDLPEREVTIEEKKVIKIDQMIKPRYGTLKVFTETESKDTPFKTPPIITLRDLSGKIRAQSTLGKLIAHYLTPDIYTIHFEPLTEYFSPNPITVKVEPNQKASSYVGTYKKINQEIAQQVIVNPNSNLIIINKEPAYLSVTSNLPRASWKLFKNNNLVFVGTGPIINYRIPEGDNYKIEPEEIEGFNVKVFPPFSFNINSREYQTIDITYTRTYGYVNIRGTLPEGETVEVTLIPEDGQRPTITELRSSGGKISWQSPPLPSGNYEVKYALPSSYDPIPSQRIYVREGKQVTLTPKMFTPGRLQVSSNTPQAIYLLKTLNGSRNWKGEGTTYSFKGLTAGSYVLSFGVQNGGYYIPPKEMRIHVNDYENKELEVTFQPAGKVVIQTNVDKAMVYIENLSSRQGINEEIVGGRQAITLPEGKYRARFSPHDQYSPPAPLEFHVRPFQAQELNVAYQAPVRRETPSAYTPTPPPPPTKTPATQMPVQVETKITITSNTPQASYTVKKVSDDSAIEVGKYSGKTTAIPISEAGEYEIEFNEIPHFKAPENTRINVGEGEQKTVTGKYTSESTMGLVPAGKAIMGNPSTKEIANERPARTVDLDAFKIGIYEVTNLQFAEWLNEAINANKIAYVTEADQRGQVLNLEGKLLFKTFEADPYSQISAQSQSTKSTQFMPVAGKDNYPVVNVSWYGAKAFCDDRNCRLPTEAEWEKAASNKPVAAGEPLKKYLYGFSQNTINRTWANFKEGEFPPQYFQVMTTPVGFYNGVNLLPLSLNSREQEKTQLAKSPYGAFDMSGNVWEWVIDWDGPIPEENARNPHGPETGTLKIAKGGCYDSLPQGVRVAERIALRPEHTDAFTGFRVARETDKTK